MTNIINETVRSLDYLKKQNYITYYAVKVKNNFIEIDVPKPKHK